MKLNRKFLAFGVAASLFLVGGLAIAQIVTLPVVTNVQTSDLFLDIVGGVPTQTNKYASAAQIAGAPGYVNLGAATTGNTYTFAKAQTNMFMQPSGTLAAVTLVTEASPSDGQRECFLSTQTTTALTWNANTGQTITGAPTAGVANTSVCMEYSAAAAEWFRAP